MSARRTFTIAQLICGGAIVWSGVWAFQYNPPLTLVTLHFAASSLFMCMIAWRLLAAASLRNPLSRIAAPETWPVYSIVCPLYREANVVPELCAALARLDYPREALDIKLAVEADDEATLAAAREASARYGLEVVALAPAHPRTKPKALNAALERVRGEFVVIYDAEDRPHPMQLRAALAAFEDGGERLACVQAPLSIDNANASWISRQFAAEYAIQFREILPLLAKLKLPIPLGGASNHFRTEALRQVGGWDPFNVTEDAELGYRLALGGWRVDTIGPPTWEEAPVRISAWLQQRARWIKGHMQTWLALMRNPFRTAAHMGLRAFAAMQLVLAGGVIAAFAHGPIFCIVLIAAISPRDILAPADFGLAVIGYCVASFTALTASALTGQLSHARAALTMPLYWPLASIAAARALFELVFVPHYWAKTAHGLSMRSPQRQ